MLKLKIPLSNIKEIGDYFVCPTNFHVLIEKLYDPRGLTLLQFKMQNGSKTKRKNLCWNHPFVVSRLAHDRY